MLSGSDSMVKPATVGQKGPPEHWLAKVREGAPELLLSEEEGGPPRVDAGALGPPEGPSMHPEEVRKSRPLAPNRPSAGVAGLPRTQTGEGHPSRQERNFDLERPAAPPATPAKHQAKKRVEETERDIRRHDRVVASATHAVDVQNRGFGDLRIAEPRPRDTRLSEVSPRGDSLPVLPREIQVVQEGEAGVAEAASVQRASGRPRSSGPIENDEIVVPVKLHDSVKVPRPSRPAKIQPQEETEQHEPARANVFAQSRARLPELEYVPSQSKSRSYSGVESAGSEVSVEWASEPSSWLDKSQQVIRERPTTSRSEPPDGQKARLLPQSAPQTSSTRTGRWPKLLAHPLPNVQSNARLSDMQRELFLLREQRGGD